MFPELIHSRLLRRAQAISCAACRKSAAETAKGHNGGRILMATAAPRAAISWMRRWAMSRVNECSATPTAARGGPASAHGAPVGRT